MAHWLGYWSSSPTVAALNLEYAAKKLGWQTATVSRLDQSGLAILVNGPAASWQRDQTLAGLTGYSLANSATRLLSAEISPADLPTANQQTAGQYTFWHFAGGQGLTLGHDHFGAERVFYGYAAEALWFSNDLASLLAVAPWREKRQLNLAALHSYLAFSFVAAPHTLIQGIQVIPPQTVLTFSRPDAPATSHQILPPLIERETGLSEIEWTNRLQVAFDQTMQRWVQGVSEVAVHLSGGLDSSAVAAWLVKNGIRTRAFHLDFAPPHNAERPYAEQTAAYLGIPLDFVPVTPDPKTGGLELRQLVTQLGEPWGDPVTLPLARGYRAVRAAGYNQVFNGEGGDQLLAGWPNRAMLTAEIYGAAGYGAHAGRLQSYLQTFHHFYGLENALYDSALLLTAQQSPLEVYITPYLEEPALPDLFDRLRWTNFWLKGSQNIMPRAAVLSRQAGLQMRAPFFDWELAQFALALPFELLMRGTQEKYLFKQMLAQANLLPSEILERPKRGMGVPATDWCLQPLHSETKKLLARLGKRGLFRKTYLDLLAKGQDLPSEIRRYRRLGEKIWQLLILELWLEIFYD